MCGVRSDSSDSNSDFLMTTATSSKKPSSLLMIISGPAGSGKTTVCTRLLETFVGKIARVITCTTRKPRRNEIDGEDYYFFSEEAFVKKIHENAFFEHAQVFSHHYGTLKSSIIDELKADKKDLLMIIDVQGAATLLQKAEEDPFLKERLITIFIMPPSLDELRRRLFDRGENTVREIEHRVGRAHDEIQCHKMFQYCILSSSREEDFQKLSAVYVQEKERLKHLI
jgi:guanylate kinase